MARHHLTVFALLMTILCGCAHVMSEQGLKQVDQSIEFPELKKKPEQYAGKRVLLGGVISGTRSSGDVLMLEVIQLDLLKNGIPDELSHSGGRFMVISSELVDPVIYRPGKLVTMIGEVKGVVVQKLESVDYPYPLVSVRELRLFRPSEPFPTYPGNPYQSIVGDRRPELQPPGPPDGEPRRR